MIMGYRLRMIYTIIVLCVITDCKHKDEYHEGLNIIHRHGKPYREVYVSDKVLNGIFIQFLDSPQIEKKGTYLNNMRNGLWDTMLTRNNLSQIYYVNDTPTIVLEDKYYFKYLKAPSLDFAFFHPVGWEISDSLEYGADFDSYSKTFKGVYKPNCSIFKFNSKKALTNVFKEALKHHSGDSSTILSNIISPNEIITLHLTPSDTIVGSCKVINTKTGRYCMTLSCSQSYYWYYKYIYITMLNSFNPISDIKQ